MKYQIKYTNRFVKDLKQAKKQNKNLEELRIVIEKLANEEILGTRYRDHKLNGRFNRQRECHIEPDWIMIYEIQNQELLLLLLRVGSHTELFKM